MKEIYIKNKVAYLNQGSQAIARMHRQSQSARIVNQLHGWLGRENARMEADFIRFARMVVSEELH